MHVHASAHRAVWQDQEEDEGGILTEEAYEVGGHGVEPGSIRLSAEDNSLHSSGIRTSEASHPSGEPLALTPPAAQVTTNTLQSGRTVVVPQSPQSSEESLQDSPREGEKDTSGTVTRLGILKAATRPVIT